MQRKYSSVSLYDYIKVKVTAKGEEVLKDLYGEEGLASFKKTHYDGNYYEFQFFTFANIFAPFGIGGTPYIEPNIWVCTELEENEVEIKK